MSSLSNIFPNQFAYDILLLVGVFAPLQIQSQHWCVSEDFAPTDPLTPFNSMWQGLIKNMAWIAL